MYLALIVKSYTHFVGQYMFDLLLSFYATIAKLLATMQNFTAGVG